MRKNDADHILMSQLVAQSTANASAIEATAAVINKMRNESKDVNSAIFNAMSRRQRPEFVNTLREKGYTQEEIGQLVGRSQSSISQYEKKFKLQTPPKTATKE